MPIRETRQYKWETPKPYPAKTVSNYAAGFNTRDPETDVVVRKAENVRFNLSTGWQTRLGSIQKGNQIGTSAPISGLMNYTQANLTSYLLASYNGEIYNFSTSNTPTTVTTSTSATATGYGKDDSVFSTTSVDANGNPYVAIIFQTGSAIVLRYAAYPYTSWSSAVTIASSTSTHVCGYIRADDSIDVAYYDSGSTSVKYCKMSYSGSGVWSAGSLISVDSSSSVDAPTIIYESAKSVIHIAFGYYDGTQDRVGSRYSNDQGATWSSLNTTDYLSADPVKPALCYANTTVWLVSQDVGVGGVAYFQTSWTGSAWTSTVTTRTSPTALGTGGQFSVTPNGSNFILTTDDVTSSKGISTTVFGTAANATIRRFNTVNVGSSEDNIQYQDGTGGSFGGASNAITTGTNENLYPKSPTIVASNASFVPVMWVKGTSSPYSIVVNSATQWSALSASMTAGNTVTGSLFPFTAAGGTGSFYMVNGVDTPRKWDGTTLSTASATGYPKPLWIFSQDDRLLMGGGIGHENEVQYTDLGADNWTGTFTADNFVYLPEKIVYGMWYRDSISFLFSNNNIYTLENFDYTGATSTPPRKIPNSYGTLSGATVQQVGMYVYYQRPDGQIMRTNGTSAELVSDSIYPTLSGLATAQLNSACAGTIGTLYYLSVAESGVGENNILIVLDTRGKGSFSIDRGKYVSCMCNALDANGVPVIYYGDSRISFGNVYQMDTGNTDNGTAFTSIVETGIVVTGDLFSADLLRDILFVTKSTPGASLTFGWTGWTNTNSFKTQTFSIDTGASKWGTGKWGDGRMWGGSTEVEQSILGVYLMERGFKFQVSCQPTTGTIQFISLTATYQPITDRP